MTQAELPIVMCDHEDGCDEWFQDHHEQGVINWRELVPAGWDYDPYDDEDDFCPKHADPERETT